MKERLEQIFRDVFDDETIRLDAGMTAEDIEAWDSLTHFELVMEIEKAFGIRFTTGEVASFSSVGQLMELLEKHTGDRK